MTVPGENHPISALGCRGDYRAPGHVVCFAGCLFEGDQAVINPLVGIECDQMKINVPGLVGEFVATGLLVVAADRKNVPVLWVKVETRTKIDLKFLPVCAGDGHSWAC